MTLTAQNKSQIIVAHGDSYLSLTHRDLNLATLQQYFDKAKTAYAARDYRGAIESYTKAISNLETFLLPTLLLHRAGAHEMEQAYELALQDCQSTQKNGQEGQLADAYLGAGSALVLQNKLDQAAQMYKEGTETVLESDFKHTELVKKHKQVVVEMDTRNQWLVQRLPLEVIHRILSFSTVQSRALLSITCRYWNSYMKHQWPELWHDLDATEVNFTIKAPVVRQFLETKAQNKVKRLKLDMRECSMQDALQNVKKDPSALVRYPSHAVLYFMRRQNWCQLESIEIVNILNLDIELLNKILEASKNTLKSIKISCDVCSETRSPAQIASFIMQRYTHLQTITLDTAVDYHLYERNSGPSIELPSDVFLTQLTVSSIMKVDKLDQLLDSSPFLASLSIQGSLDFDDATVIKIVNDHCRSLQYFSYIESRRSVSSNYIGTYTRLQPHLQIPRALERLDLFRNPDPEYKENLIAEATALEIDQSLTQLLIKCHKTLKTLSIDFSSMPSKEHQWLQALKQLGAPQLRALELSESGCLTQFSPQRLCQLITACPLLEKATLKGGTFWHDIVFDALGKCTTLQDLTICHDGYMPDTNVALELSGQGMISAQGLDALLTQTKTIKRFTFEHVYREDPHHTYRQIEVTPPPQPPQLPAPQRYITHRHSGARRSQARRPIFQSSHQNMSYHHITRQFREVLASTREPSYLSADTISNLMNSINASPKIEELTIKCLDPEIRFGDILGLLKNPTIRQLTIFNVDTIQQHDIEALISLVDLQYIRLYGDITTRKVAKSTLIKVFENIKNVHPLVIVIGYYPHSSGWKGSKAAHFACNTPTDIENLDKKYNIQELERHIKRISKNYYETESEKEQDSGNEWYNTGETFITCKTCGRTSHYSNFEHLMY